jgi:hypothetical protein
MIVPPTKKIIFINPNIQINWSERARIIPRTRELLTKVCPCIQKKEGHIPLQHWLRKRAIKQNLSKELRDAFNCSLECSPTRPTLEYPKLSRKFIIYTDATGYAIGAALTKCRLQLSSTIGNHQSGSRGGDQKVFIENT